MFVSYFPYPGRLAIREFVSQFVGKSTFAFCNSNRVKEGALSIPTTANDIIIILCVWGVQLKNYLSPVINRIL